MALHTDLPIFKPAYDLLRVAEAVILQMPREVKVGIGRKLRDECLEITDLIAEANIAKDKVPHIAQIRSHIRKVELLVRVSWDNQYIKHPGYRHATQLTQSLGRQATRWMQSSAKQVSAVPPVA